MKSIAACAVLLLGAASGAASQELRGRELIVQSRCLACHDIPGSTGIEFKADALDNAGEKLRASWLHAWLLNPRSHASARMGDFRLNAADRSCLEAFLLSQRSRPVPLGAVNWEAADTRAGRKSFEGLQCATCHTADTMLDPGKLRRDWVFALLKDPRQIQPGTPMLKYALPESEVRDLTAYVLKEFRSPSASAEPERRPQSDAQSVAMGRALFERRGCDGCHRTTAMPAGQAKIGPSLVDLSARHSEAAPARDFVIRKLRSPGAPGKPSRMPTYEFSPTEAADVAQVLLSR
jgi:cytochrome c2